MPIFRLKRDLIGFAAMKKHCSLFLMGTTYSEEIKEELSKFEISGKTVHFTPDKPLPKELIEKIIQARLVDVM